MVNPKNKMLLKILITMALSTAIVMTCFEIIKQNIHAEITIWESHIVTIAFTTLISIVLTFFGLRKHHSILRILSGFIPICAWCKKIRDDKGDWVAFDVYLGKYSNAEFTHGVCPECEIKVFRNREKSH